MTLRTRILFTGGSLRCGGCVLILGCSWYMLGAFAADVWLLWLRLFGIIGAGTWLVCCWPILRYVLLPALFPYVRCTNPDCRYEIPLTQRWQIGENYKHHCSAHILTVHDDRGREIGTFECPQCRTTIPVQKGTGSKFAVGKILGNAFAYAPGEDRPSWIAYLRELLPFWNPGLLASSFPVGLDRQFRYRGIQWLIRRLRRRQLRRLEYIPELVWKRHILIFGKSNMGKSTFLQWLGEWIFNNGMGATFIDKTGHLAKDLVRLVPKHRINDVIWIRAWDKENAVGMNVLEETGGIVNVRDQALEALETIYPKSWGDNIKYDIGKGIDTVLPFGGTLEDVYDLFTKPTVRKEMIAQLDDEELIAFWERIDKMRTTPAAALKLHPIVKHDVLGPMLCSRNSNFNANEIIRDKKIVIVDTRSGSKETNTIAGVFIVSKLRAAAEEEEVRHFLIIDEAAKFMHPGMDLEGMFSEMRKFKMTMVLATQFPDQLRTEVRKSAFTNSGVLMSFGVDIDDGKLLAERMDGVNAEAFTRQSEGECIARIHNKVVFLKTQFPKKPDADPTKIIEANMHALNRERPEKLAGGDDEERGATKSPDLSAYTALVCDGVR